MPVKTLTELAKRDELNGLNTDSLEADIFALYQESSEE